MWGFDVAESFKDHYNMNVMDPHCFWTSATSRNMLKIEGGPGQIDHISPLTSNLSLNSQHVNYKIHFHFGFIVTTGMNGLNLEST